MSKQGSKQTPRYSKAEQRAEAEIDQFLHSVSPTSQLTVLQDLRDLA